VAQLFELVGKGVGGNPVCRRMRLVVGKAEMARLGGLGTSRARRGEAQRHCEQHCLAAHADLSLRLFVIPAKAGIQGGKIAAIAPGPPPARG